MAAPSPDQLVLEGGWSDLSRYREMPEIDFERLKHYRISRLREMLKEQDAAMCILVSPVSLRYAVDFQTYQIFQSHIPISYAYVAQEGPTVLCGAYGTGSTADEERPARPVSFFDGANELGEAARLLAEDVVAYLDEIGTDNRRVAVEYVNPSITQALLQRGLEVIDGVTISEAARVIKSEDEIACIRWAVAVSEMGMAKMREALVPGVTEVQLWGLLNYTNLANNGGWHEGRMLASGPRINPWYQEATQRAVEPGDLVAFDTDMVGPFGYFSDVSRTFLCGPARPNKRQKELYRLALEEVEHNLTLIRPGLTFSELQEKAWPVPEEFRENAYACIVHGVGMADEYPRVNYGFRGPNFYDGTIEAGMVICVESYMGAVGEPYGVKYEEQILVTKDGYDMLSSFPREEALLE